MAFVKITEQPSLYDNLEEKSVREILQDINTEDQKVALAVQQAIPQIEKLVTQIVPRMKQGGRIFYLGAGTSGRLGVLDASEIPPTFGMPPSLVIGLIAGGDTALRNPVENAEDDMNRGWEELQEHGVNNLDTVIGIAASGTTPYVVGALRAARAHGILTASISSNPDSPIAHEADVPIEMIVGPEFVTGSSRMKSGTGQKMILNMISTSVMIQLGRVKGNRMVNMQLTNQKLVDRGTRMVLISGPSSSGKTTFSKRLAVQLMACGLKPVPISLDDYFVDREKTPRAANGDYDFEHIDALDIPLLTAQLKALLAGEEVELPRYNFQTGKREASGQRLKLEKNMILVLEGIHALNPMLTEKIPEDRKYKIYVSALTTIKLDDHNYIPNTDNRMMRRIVRDYKYRGCSAEETIRRWPSVRRGEDKWIFPYQERADAMFNSALLFELAVLRNQVMSLLDNVQEDKPEYAEAFRLKMFLRLFYPISSRELPPTSLLREFLGGSSFRY